MLVSHYIRTGGFAPVWSVNASTAFASVSQQVSEITFLFRCSEKINHLKIKAMERRVKFNTVTQFVIAEEELKHLYTIMALVQYPYDSDPEYRDYNLIRRLRNDFKRFNVEITKLGEIYPNNLVLSQIRLFIQKHYGYLKRVNSALEQTRLK